MLKTLAAQVKEFKKDSMLAPVFMIMEVIMEMIIPFLMASIIDDGVGKGDILTNIRRQDWLQDLRRMLPMCRMLIR